MGWQLITYKNVLFSKNGRPISDPYFYHCVHVFAVHVRSTYIYMHRAKNVITYVLTTCMIYEVLTEFLRKLYSVFL